ncbi:MAG TPA: hypothetical protein VK116_16045, partial [Planctomycetota bacterium]|nr:hypothetical protein [Planctomycetota bacterium]
LLQFPLRKLIFLRGVGKKTRDELVACVKELRRRFPAVEEQRGVASVEEPSPADDDAKTGEGELVLDAIYRRIVGRPPAKKGGELRFEVRRSLLADDREATFPEDWFPTHGELAERHRCSTARVGQILADERVRWGKDSRMRELRERFAESLRSAAGVFTLAEATDAVLSLVDAGGANTPEVRLRAVAVVRALVEAESTSESPRFDAFRSRDRVFIAVARPFVAWAVALGDEADDIARADPLLAPERAIERLRLIALSESPAGGFGVEVSIADDERLLRLAASVGTIAELSARREIYPRDMPADRALKLGAGALSGLGVGASEVEGGATARLDLRPGEFDPEEVRQRIRARYPKARELPQPTELDRLLREVGIDVEWDAARGVYRRAATHALVTTSGRSPLPRRLPTLPPRERREIAPEVAEARQFEELLRDRYERGSFLVLTVSEHEMVPCGEELHRRFNEGGRTLERVSLDREILRAMREVVRRENFDWNVVREVDRAGPSSREWLDLVDIAKAA